MSETPKWREMALEIFEFTKKQRVASFQQLNPHAHKGGIVFVGDSITEGFPVHELLNSDIPTYNRGISGEHTHGIISNLKDLVLDLEPSKVFLLIGTNDLGDGKNPELIIHNIEDICQAIKKTLPDIELHVISVYPINSDERVNQAPFPVVGIRTNEHIQAVNQGIREVATRLHLTYIDLYPMLVGEDGQLRQEYTYDGLHLTIQGYQVVINELQQYL